MVDLRCFLGSPVTTIQLSSMAPDSAVLVVLLRFGGRPRMSPPRTTIPPTNAQVEGWSFWGS